MHMGSFFFFKQKTAYEMRISDWSSDVCSSDLKLYGPTGVGVLWSDKLDTLPPWQGGGSMIDRVTFAKTTYAPAPTRFEAGTPAIIEAIGLAAAVDYVEALGIDAIHAHECALVGTLREALARKNSITLFGPENSAGIVSFAIDRKSGV